MQEIVDTDTDIHAYAVDHIIKKHLLDHQVLKRMITSAHWSMRSLT